MESRKSVAGNPTAASGGVYPLEQMKKADEFARMAKAGDTNLLERIRKWAGGDIQRRIWACDIVRNAGAVRVRPL
jgi:hypothetical protein